jgi:O-antigen ligase
VIATREGRSVEQAPFVRLVQAVFWPVLVVVLSLVVGVLAIQLSDHELRWLAYAIAGIVLAAGTVVTGVHKALLTYFVLGLSADVHYYVTTPTQAMFVGNSSPGAISVPLCMIPGLGILGRQLYLQYVGMSRFQWGAEIGKPALAVILTTLLAVAVSPMRFVGFCVVMQLVWLYLLYLATLNAVRTRADVQLVVRLLLIVLLIQCAFFLLQIATGVKFSAVGKVYASEAAGQSIWHQATGPAAITTAGFATFIEPIIMVAFALWRTGRAEVNKPFTLFVAALGAVVTVLTLNRSSWIGILIGLGTVELTLRARGLVARYNLNWRTFALIGALGLIFLVGLQLLASKRSQQDHESDWAQRFDLMKPATRMIAANPVFGVGPGVYGYALRRYSWGWTGWIYIVHNDYLLAWAERGTIGFVAFVFWLRAALRLARRASRWTVQPYGILGVGVLGGLIVHMWEVFWTQCMSFPAYGLLWLLLALLVTSEALTSEAGQAVPARTAA